MCINTIITDRLVLKTNCQVTEGKIDFPTNSFSSLFDLEPTRIEDEGFAIYLNSGTLVGHIIFLFKRNVFELSVGVETQYQKKGYMSEAQRAVIDWIFEYTDYDSVWALLGGITDQASRKLLKRSGFIICNKDSLEWWVLDRGTYNNRKNI